MRVSRYFKLGRSQPTLDFVDVRYDRDTPLFVNPRALEAVPSQWGAECVHLIKSFFGQVMADIKAGRHQSAEALLATLREPNETHLGLSKRESRGRALGRESAKNVWYALSRSKAAKSGLISDLEDTALFIDGVGPDIISDITTNIIRGPLIEYTQQVCRMYGIKLSPGIPTGPIWHPTKKAWIQDFAELPMTPRGKLLLVPKAIVRRDPIYNLTDYYSNYLVAHLRTVELDANSSLVHIVKKTKERKVYKKRIEEKYGKAKSDVVRETINTPAVLARYKREKAKQPDPSLTHAAIAQAQGTDTPDWSALMSAVKAIPPGKAHSTAYERAIEALLSALFYPDLAFPVPQEKIHEGRKVIDISYTNMSKGGFFFWLSHNYSAANVIVECKNYSKDIANPEVDQIAGRFNPSKGKVGIIVARSYADKQLIQKRCRDAAKDDRGYIIALDDADIEALVESRRSNAKYQEWQILLRRFQALTN